MFNGDREAHSGSFIANTVLLLPIVISHLSRLFVALVSMATLLCRVTVGLSFKTGSVWANKIIIQQKFIMGRLIKAAASLLARLISHDDSCKLPGQAGRLAAEKDVFLR